MLTINLKNLSKEAQQHLEKWLQWIEKVSRKPRSFHTKKALIWYLKSANRFIKHYEKESKKRNPVFTREDLLQQTGLWEAKEREKELFRNLKKINT